MYTIKFTNGASTETFETSEQVEAHIESEISAGYVIEWFPDRALVWASEAIASNDDGARAIASITWTVWNSANAHP